MTEPRALTAVLTIGVLSIVNEALAGDVRLIVLGVGALGLIWIVGRG